jgi:hypothetical protein
MQSDSLKSTGQNEMPIVEQRRVALSAGDLHRAKVHTFIELQVGDGKDLRATAHSLIRRLRESSVITVVDAARLTQIVDIVASDVSGAEKTPAVEGLHQEAVDDPSSTPEALAFSAIALDSVRLAQEKILSANASTADVVGALVEGAIHPRHSPADHYWMQEYFEAVSGAASTWSYIYGTLAG